MKMIRKLECHSKDSSYGVNNKEYPSEFLELVETKQNDSTHDTAKKDYPPTCSKLYKFIRVLIIRW